MKRPILTLDSPLDSSGGFSSRAIAMSIAPPRPSSGVRARLTRTNLTAGATPLVGRKVELDALRDLVVRERCVTLVGAAGVGKTRLARECAVYFLDEFMRTGGVWFVDVSRAQDEAEVVAEIANALDAPVDPHDARATAMLAAALASRGPMLVVLDDASDCAGDVASLVEHVGRSARDVRWLVTSRVRLEAPREAILELGGLTLPLARLDPRVADSVQLFVERARTARVGWTLDSPSTVAAIVRALDGNALAIEIAATWVATTTIDDLLSRVTPGGAPPEGARRQRNEGLGIALDAAWADATVDEKAALTAIARLGEGFDLDSDAMIIGVSAPRATIPRLAAHALLARVGNARFEVPRAVREGLGLRGEDAEARSRRVALVFERGELSGAPRSVDGADYATDLERAFVALHADDRSAARSSLASALEEVRALDDRCAEARVLAGLSALEAQEDAPDSARAAIHRAAECLGDPDGDPDTAALIEACRGFLEVALARDAARAGDEEQAQAYVREARGRTAAKTADPTRESIALRLARRALSHACDGAQLAPSSRRPLSLSSIPPAPGELPAGCVAVCARGTWFRTPDGPVVSIARWLALQNLLVRISEHREIAPNAALTVEALVAAGWPGERILQKAGATRVYTALSTLRRLGLRGVLLRRAGGYLLDPTVPIFRVSSTG